MRTPLMTRRIGLKDYRVTATDEGSIGADIDLERGEIRVCNRASVKTLLDAIETAQRHEQPPSIDLPIVDP